VFRPTTYSTSILVSDQTVEVGAKLYEIDTEATATASAPTTPEPVATPKGQELPTVAATPAASAAVVSVPHGRTPSIHFLGKEGWAKQLSPAPAAAPKLPAKPNATTTLDGSFLTPMYGRPIFSEKEMEALILGGANIAPSVKTFSTGSTFVV
jgi:pyruvate/2-oxoglutarate dehydrogenase complex dihydrolipoamide acyltransferase (E2) component